MRTMKTEIQRDMKHSFFLVWTEAGVRESYEIRMITENKIPGLLPCQCRPLDDQVQMCFDIDSLFSLAELAAEKKLKSGSILALIKNLYMASEGLEEFLLKPERLSLNPEHIFADRELGQMFFCYMPEREKNTGEAFRELTEYLLPRLDHQDAEGVALGYGIYRYSMEEEFRMDTLKQTVQAILEKNSRMPGTKWKPEEEELWESEEERVRRLRHEEALEAFFGEDREEEQEQPEGRWKIAVSAGILLVHLGIGYALWKRGSLYLGVWGIIGILGAAAAGVGVFLRNREREEKEGEEKYHQMREWRKDFESQHEEWGKQRSESGSGEQQKDRERRWKRGDIEYKQEKRGEKWESEQYERREEENGEMEIHRIQMEDRGSGKSWGEDIREGKKEMPEMDETDVLGSVPEARIYCLREIASQEGEILRLTGRRVHIVGKLTGTADLLIRSPTVSRIHARIRKTGNQWMIKDMNSKNGTYINGKRICGEQEAELKEGDQVRFAEKSYVFGRE